MQQSKIQLWEFNSLQLHQNLWNNKVHKNSWNTEHQKYITLLKPHL